MDDDSVMKGQCSCGKVAFEVTGPMQRVYYCHCRDCQVQSGSAFQILAVIGKNNLQINAGRTSSFEKTVHGGYTMTREFCADCGSPVVAYSTQWNEISMFSVAALENPDVLKPEFQIWQSSALNWATIPENIDSFPHGALDGG